jgi:hypothetical protein
MMIRVEGRPRRAGEDAITRYARQTRNAAVTLAVLACVAALITVIATVLAVSAINRVSKNLQGGVGNISGSSNCLSQGGTNPNC